MRVFRLSAGEIKSAQVRWGPRFRWTGGGGGYIICSEGKVLVQQAAYDRQLVAGRIVEEYRE
jgi:hypothetical protein